jgi:S-(hydroxymethyl)glutathione dehydrogenase/alcohol dehydrogenase
MTKAAVFNAVQEPLTIEKIDIADPIDREVLVRTAASGVCHSDLHFIEGLYPMPNRAILGHEAAGVVEAVGPNVTEVEAGDHVIACLSVYCGQCDYCLTGRTHLCGNRPARAADQTPRLSQDGKMLTQFASIGSYAEQMLLHENGVVKIEKDFPFAQAALIGCGVTTGVGAALKTAKVTPGSTVAVFGAGGVGLSAIQGARIAGARKIIAVDMVEHKLQTARELGATDGVDASLGDPVEQIRELTDGQGVDFAFEAIGLKVAAEQAWQALRPGGTATVIGMIPIGQNVEIPGNEFLREKKIQGSSMGSNSFKVDMPQYIEFYKQGRLKLDEMITKTRPLEEINEAFADMKSGEVTRSVIMFD